MKGIDVTVMGDQAVGKTHFISHLCKKIPPELYDPTVFDQSSVQWGGTIVSFWECGGAEDYRSLAPLSIREGNLFLVCFSLISLSSFKSATEYWIDVARKHSPDCKIFLIGCKKNLQHRKSINSYLASKGTQVPSSMEAHRFASSISIQYFEVTDSIDSAHNTMKAILQTLDCELVNVKRCCLVQ